MTVGEKIPALAISGLLHGDGNGRSFPHPGGDLFLLAKLEPLCYTEFIYFQQKG